MKNKKHTLASVGEKVFYEGRVGIIERLSHTFNGRPTLCLVNEENEEQTCTALESDCITLDCYFNGDALSESGIQY